MSATPVPDALRFGHYTLDLARGCLRGDGRDIELRPKTFAVLTHLVQNAGRLVSKDELLHAVWPDVVVSDESLTKCVSEIRAALGHGGQHVVKTVPRRGYLLAVPVSRADGQAAPAVHEPTGGDGAFEHVPPVAPARRRRVVLVASLLLLTLTAISLVTAWRWTGAAPGGGRASIAVLPFENASEPRADYFSDGLTEDLITGLGRFRELFVIGRDSTFVYKRKPASPGQVGRELGVRYLVQGSVRRDGDRVRVTARLIDATTGGQVWGETYERAVTSIFAVQDDVTQNIVRSLVAHIDRSELARIARKPPATFAAYDFYLRGKALITLRHGEGRGAMVAEARRFFEQAREADPRYAPAVQGLAYTYAAGFLEPMRDGALAGELRQPAVLARAHALAQEAVELDPYLAEAHATLAWVLHWQYRRREALAEFQRALEVNPNLADGRFAHLLVHNGRAREAVTYMQEMMRQDPFPPPMYLSYLGNAYYMTGQYDEAYATLRNGWERMPDYRSLSVWLAAAAAQSGRAAEAGDAARRVLASAPQFTIRGWIEHIRFARQEDADRLAEGLRKAGLPS